MTWHSAERVFNSFSDLRVNLAFLLDKFIFILEVLNRYLIRKVAQAECCDVALVFISEDVQHKSPNRIYDLHPLIVMALAIF